MSKCQRDSWDKEETDYLLHLIRERQILKSLDGKKFRAEEIFHHLEKPMHDRGYLKSARQMQTKFKTLRFNFNKYKRKMSVSGEGNLRRHFPFYSEMEVLLGDRPVATLQGIDSANTSSTQSDSSSSIDQNESNNASNDEAGPSSQIDDPLDEEVTSNEVIAEVINEPLEVNTPAGSSTDEPEIRPQTPRPSHRVRTGRKSTQKSLEKFADLCQENALQRQDAAAGRQEQFISQLFENQRNFEQEMMSQFFEQQRQIMRETTSSLLLGLRGIFQPQFTQGPSRHGLGCQCPECVPFN